MLTLGLDLGSRSNEFFQEMNKRDPIVHVYQEDHEAGTLVNGNVTEVNVMSLTFIRELNVKLNGKFKSRWLNIEKKISAFKSRIESELEKKAESNSEAKPIHPAFVCNCITKVADKDAIITTDMGGHTSWMEVYYRPYSQNAFITPGRYGSMGFSIPAGITAKKIYPDRQVISMAGDGGILMTMSEISTAVALKSDSCIIVFNDAKYGMI